MALKGNGQLLIKIKQQAFGTLFAGVPPLSIPGYTLRPLCSPPQGIKAFALSAAGSTVADHWSVAAPATAGMEHNPWDVAHQVARANGYSHYVEPDLLHERVAEADFPHPAEAPDKLIKGWLPTAADKVSPAWHLEDPFTGFESVRSIASGKGVRIAHLDTGYTPWHASTPLHLRNDLGHDYWSDKPDAIEPYTPDVFPLNPGHGTATLALLAGAPLNLRFEDQTYEGPFGGAWEAEVVPVRIGPSVIHLYSSSMAAGLQHALAPLGDARNRCAVVSISHGGLPSAAWAEKVNELYEAGVIIVAASGDSYNVGPLKVATRFTVYPSAFNRVLTAVGVTYGQTPYITHDQLLMQGCWGPDAVMEKAVAAYTPNVAWMSNKNKDNPSGFTMDGGGTSASTPQVAAACALWVQLYGGDISNDWRRVEACRLALFASTRQRGVNRSQLGWGTLNVPSFLNPDLARKVIADVSSPDFKKSADDSVSHPFWRLLFGAAPPDSEEERMYETEVAQILHQSRNNELVRVAVEAAGPQSNLKFSPAEQQKYRTMLLGESMSFALRQRLR